MNNLFLGTRSYALVSGSPDPRTRLDYNGYYKTPKSKYLIKWSTNNRASWGKYSNLADFYNETGHEQHGLMINYDEFSNLSRPLENKTYDPNEIKCDLLESAQVLNNGINIPNITDYFADSAPDLGCLEFGEVFPHFGCNEK